MQYVSTSGDEGGGCVFCDHLAEGDDAAAHILYRGPTIFVILNAFPYNTGHLMVAPLRHAADVEDLTEDERRELFEVTCNAIEIVRAAMGAEGFNTGMNLGSA